MLKRILFRYSILSLPFICGILLYMNGIFNIVSSLLFFIGGYVLIKNLCDYRIIRRNIYNIEKRYGNLGNNKDYNKNNNRDKGNVIDIVSSKLDSIRMDEFKNDEESVYGCFNVDNVEMKKYQSYEDIPGIKRVRCYKKVRRRY